MIQGHGGSPRVLVFIVICADYWGLAQRTIINSRPGRAAPLRHNVERSALLALDMKPYLLDKFHKFTFLFKQEGKQLL